MFALKIKGSKSNAQSSQLGGKCAHAASLNRRLSASSRRQRGAFMLEMSLAMIIAAVAAVGSMREMIRVNRMDAANIQADALLTYKAAVDQYMQANYAALQANQPVTVGAVTLAAGDGAGQSLRPTVANLIAMGYLDVGFQNFTLLTDGGAYDNIIERLPIGCLPADCKVSGFAYINQPILARGSVEEDGPLIGQMITRLGGDAASSSVVNPNTLYGGGGTYTRANPLGAQRGVIGVRFGVGASDMSQYLRVQDARDPQFQGNMSVLGDVVIGGDLGVTGRTRLGDTLTVRDGASDCVTIDKAGVVTINCNGRLNATTGVFTSGANSVSIDPATGVVSTVPVQASRVTGTSGLATSSATVFDSTDPNAISVTSGDMFIKDGAGNTMVRFNGGNVVASADVSSQRLVLRTVVGEGTACTVTAAQSDIAALSSGGIAACVGGVWRPAGRYAVMNDTCTAIGAIAMDSATGKGLVCRGGLWIDNALATAKFVLHDTELVWHGKSVPKPSCPGVPGQVSPLIILVPSTDAPPTYNSTTKTLDGVDRYAVDQGGTWDIRIVATGPGATPVMGATAIAHYYCYYP